jgi:FtsP/CotA-like multicopper oxidase with cupredoxin domain
MHWHGVRQFESNIQDGVNGVTDCPLAPGSSKTYTFKATQYGTSWYHSHFAAQYGNGVWGPIHIDGPASANYDIDLGVFPIGDHYYQSADAIVAAHGVPPSSDNILFNGTNINPLDISQGEYATVTLTPGSIHRLRVINPSVDNNYQISMVGHNFTVISTDFVPITPLVVDNIFVAVGQRYDILIDASQAVDSYWFNVTLTDNINCGYSINPYPAAIFKYEGASGNPTDVGIAPASANCKDSQDWSPVLTRTADETTLVIDADNAANQIDIAQDFTKALVWSINSSSVTVQWDKPVLEYIIEGNTSYPRSENLIFVDEANVWTYWVVQNQSPFPHPMHLHGHDFLVLGASDGGETFTSDQSSSLNYVNPTRRDVTMVAENGWLVIAFLSDNPGNWLFHCHIAWHVSGGLASDFMERRDEQVALISDAELVSYQDTCTSWKAWIPDAPAQTDSGI